MCSKNAIVITVLKLNEKLSVHLVIFYKVLGLNIDLLNIVAKQLEVKPLFFVS